MVLLWLWERTWWGRAVKTEEESWEGRFLCYRGESDPLIKMSVLLYLCYLFVCVEVESTWARQK